jgi:integrase
LKAYKAKESSNALWIGARGHDLMDLSYHLNKFTDSLCIKHLLGSENPSCHVHRFRKTLARLVALTLVNAPQILKDVFGHDDVEMTIRRYILSDPGIANEILIVQKESTNPSWPWRRSITKPRCRVFEEDW